MPETRAPLFGRLKKGLEDGIEHARGERELRVTDFVVPDPPPEYGVEGIRQIRVRLNLSQPMTSPGLATLRRSTRYGVGKEIGGAVYVHRQYQHLLGQAVAAAAARLPPGFDYTVVKLQRRTGVVSFIHSPDFDTAPEPTVGEIFTVHPDGKVRMQRQPSDPYIYHHKWLFVADDYPGFDVEASKARSQAWLSLPDVDRSRIGRRSYWTSMVLPRIPSAEQ